MAYGVFTDSKNRPKKGMIMKIVLVILVLCICCSGCLYPGIKGTVIDGVTGQPIEGALAVAQWTKKHGLWGMQYNDLYKSIETLSNKEGMFSLSGVYDPFVEPPIMIIYKEGYAPWRNDMVFPGGHLTKDNEWKHGVTYKLGVFTSNYTYEQLYQFMDYGIIGVDGTEVPIFYKIHKKVSDRAVDESRDIKAKQQKP